MSLLKSDDELKVGHVHIGLFDAFTSDVDLTDLIEANDGGLLSACHVQSFLNEGVIWAIKDDQLEFALVDAKAGHSNEDYIHDICADVPIMRESVGLVT